MARSRMTRADLQQENDELRGALEELRDQEAERLARIDEVLGIAPGDDDEEDEDDDLDDDEEDLDEA
jgi:hypothetical protein